LAKKTFLRRVLWSSDDEIEMVKELTSREESMRALPTTEGRSIFLAAQARRSNAASVLHADDPKAKDGDLPLVELRNVSHCYKGIRALRHVSLSIRPGEFFSLLGPSGCGKTTTLNLIGGFVVPDEGDVLIQGRSVARVPPYARPVNTVFQNYALFPHMTVEENIAFGPRMARQYGPDIARRVDEALALVSLSGMEKRRPDQLSGGQQQRVALARALINRPSVLLLDEPLGALDLKLRKQMQVELSRIQREVGITFIYVTHDQEEALAMSDRIAVMNRGSVMQTGSPAEVYERPASLFVADFIGSSNKLHGRLLDYAGGSATVQLDCDTIVQVPMLRPIPAGSRMVVLVRPDHAVIVPADAERAGVNAVQGQVAKVAYLGTHLEIEIVLPDASNVMVRQSLAPAERRQPGPDPGDDVVVTWPIPQSIGFSEERSDEGH
jgi:spermidine/putrescine transport system ATP-binding protein